MFYTIGYAHHTQESFLKLLEYYHIQCVIDVRTLAYSGFHPQFNKEPLKYFLNSHGILYRQMHNEFGIIRSERSLLNAEGYLDFTKVAALPEFKKGIEQMIRGIEKGYHVAFMCAEKAPQDCHRSTLVARALKEKGYEIHHILWNGKIVTQDELEQSLLECYFPNREQIDLFDTSEKEKLNRAYELQSNQIAAVNAKRVLKDRYEGPKLKK